MDRTFTTCSLQGSCETSIRSLLLDMETTVRVYLSLNEMNLKASGRGLP